MDEAADLWKLVTTLGGFENLKLNQIADTVHRAKAERCAGGGVASVSGKLTYRLLRAAMTPAVVGAYVSGSGPKDDENAGEWAAKRALLFAPETVPLAGQIIRIGEEGRDASFSPIADALAKSGMAAFEASKDSDTKDWTKIGIDAGTAAGLVSGVPGTVQAARIARYAHRADLGGVDDPNLWDAVVGAPPHK